MSALVAYFRLSMKGRARSRARRASAYAEPRERMEESKYIEQPYDHSDDHNPVEDRLDRSLHGDEAVNQPEKHSDCDERKNNLDERHSVLLSSRSRRPESENELHSRTRILILYAGVSSLARSRWYARF